MLSGLPEIDISDWKEQTDYSGLTNDSPIVEVQ